ncbi:glycoside hydrolase family 3 C-terminal domain-containing protein [Pontibacter sp. E15-1]|uniref:glycoside hydrolase family 3 N-terminal domain-containing protein n=1 Tax=Pontibacter sp. E15-1 TaxID=2919918 RepID=UPI001F4F2653|nr:glycoside hydrolase family 3 N-terminal domain-containing protein [Pontibacter sp. E15-1]MCJ8164408.1 glycoside hydrolase family 3 C-terminal domain-containing protein [Pontibacter sp. E15-1]
MRIRTIAWAACIALTCFSNVQAQKSKTGTVKAEAPYNEAELNKKVEALLQKMTLEEKVGQMAQITLDVVGKGENRYTSFEPLQLDKEALKRALVDYKIGSVLNTANNTALTPQKWYSLISEIQQVAMKDTRLGIPVIYGVDEIHGATYTVGATMFPQQINQAASRNRALVKRGAEITAYETRASSIPWNFSPVLDLAPDPRFPRQFESFGEDPYLTTELGVQMIDGYEGVHNNIGHPEHVASCMKHFLGYQVPTSGKDRTPTTISDVELREYHLPSFKAAIDAGAHTIMINSGIVNGVPVHSNHDILTKLLKEELGFKGLVVTDWGDIEYLHNRDRVASDMKEAIMLAINAGIDMSMIPYQYEPFCDGLVELVKEGKVKEERINDAVRRVLRVKYALNLFERPTTNPKDYPKFGSKEFEDAAYQMAAESITLLKNQNGVLPLKKTAKVLVTGPNANNMRTLNGAWTYSWQGEKTDAFAARYNTILEAVQQEVGNQNVTYVPGVSYKMEGKYYEETADQMAEALAAAQNVDVVILCIGENTSTETPGNLNDLYLSDLQTELTTKLLATGKPVVLVLNEGRPRIISRIEPNAQAIVQIYQPGNFGGNALADVLFGDVNPSGKLPYNYPRYPNAIVPYIHKPAAEQGKAAGVYNYEADYSPQYEFGHGLSYTTFKYSGLKLSKPEIGPNEKLTVSVTVQNTGQREGKETIQLFTSDLYASGITPDVRRLRRFEKITLKPGETRTVSFTLTPDDLAYTARDGKRLVEAGAFEVQIADQTQKFNLTETNTL